MPKQKKQLNIIPVIVTIVLLAIVAFFVKPNKLFIYAKAKYGTQNTILMYQIDKNADNYKTKKSELRKFFQQRGIPGLAYEDKQNEYYVTLVSKDTNPKTEINFGFTELDPAQYYKNMYAARQVYFLRTLKTIED